MQINVLPDLAPSRSGRGGSAARRALRQSGLKASAVHPGLPGGTYRPLSDRDMERIHATALDVLEKLGVGDPIPEILEVALAKGCRLNDKGRLCFPRALVDHATTASRQYADWPAVPWAVAGLVAVLIRRRDVVNIDTADAAVAIA